MQWDGVLFICSEKLRRAFKTFGEKELDYIVAYFSMWLTNKTAETIAEIIVELKKEIESNSNFPFHNYEDGSKPIFLYVDPKTNVAESLSKLLRINLKLIFAACHSNASAMIDSFQDFLKTCADVKDHHQVTIKRLYEQAFKSWIDDYENEQPIENRVATLKSLGLSAEDGFFVWSYTGSCSSWLNCDTRNGDSYCSECKSFFASSLESALQKLPVYEGTAWRWEEADEDLRKFNWFKNHIGLTIRVPYFLSTSKDDITADPMLWEIKTISGGHARDISEISNAPSEQEILFIPNAKFKIVGVKDDNRTVTMQEIAQDIETEFDLCLVYDHDPDDIDPDMIEPGLFD